MENNQNKVPMEPKAPEMLTDEELKDIAGGPYLVRQDELPKGVKYTFTGPNGTVVIQNP